MAGILFVRHHSMHLLSPPDYQPRADVIFAEVQRQLSAVLSHARIEHVGSSSIPGAFSKGDIDICVAVDREHFDNALSTLKRLNYIEKVDTLRTEQLCMLEAPRTDVDLAIQLIERGSTFEFFVKFRDTLRSNPALVQEYNAIKSSGILSGQDAYREAKSAFIQRIIEA